MNLFDSYSTYVSNPSGRNLNDFMTVCRDQCYGLIHSAVYGKDVEDILQEAFYKLQKELEKGAIFQTEHAITGFLFTVATNLGRNSHRKSERITALPEDYDIPDISRSEDDLILVGILEAWAESLPRTQQLVFRLRLAGNTNPEIAKMLDMKMQSVKLNLSRGYKTLRERYKSDPRKDYKDNST